MNADTKKLLRCHQTLSLELAGGGVWGQDYTCAHTTRIKHYFTVEVMGQFTSRPTPPPEVVLPYPLGHRQLVAHCRRDENS